MKILFGSDLHLEFGRGDLDVPECDVLLLAGDIFLPWAKNNLHGSHRNQWSKIDKRQEKFWAQVAERVGQCYVIAGNHEHYHGKFYHTEDRITSYIGQYPNIKFLENETAEFGEYVLFGATFWTDINGADPLVCLEVEGAVNDYHVIWHDGFMLKSEVTIAENKYTRGKLVDFFESLPVGKTPIVMTHHAPFYMSVPDRFKTDQTSFAYANSKMEYLVNPYNVPPCFWIHGHMHDRFTYSFGNIQVLCHPRGYWGEQGSRGYAFVELPEKVLVEAA